MNNGAEFPPEYWESDEEYTPEELEYLRELNVERVIENREDREVL